MDAEAEIQKAAGDADHVARGMRSTQPVGHDRNGMARLPAGGQVFMDDQLIAIGKYHAAFVGGGWQPWTGQVGARIVCT